MKKIIMVKVRYFCMRQKDDVDNVVNLSHILCQKVQLRKLYNLMKKYWSTFDLCTKCIQNA
jgi:phage pi2 protein 07